MPKAYSYIRFSSSEQSKGRSHARQLEDCEKYCRENGLDLAREDEYTFLDLGRSGYKAEHLGDKGQLARFLRLVKDGTIAPGSFLIVESLDRLSREHVKQALPRFMDLLNQGIEIVTLSDGRRYSGDFTPEDLILSIFVMARAHEESVTKAKRVGDAWRKKQDKAREENKPIGKAVPLWLIYTPESYVLNEERAKVVRKVFQMTIAGYGKASIAKFLNAEGIPSFKNKSWGASSVDKLLNNRAVFGEYQPYSIQSGVRTVRGEPISKYFPEVVDESIFYQAQAAIRGRRSSKATKQSPRFNVWQGIMHCGYCLKPMHLVNKGKPPKGHTYLQCSYARKGLCKGKAIRLDASEIVFKEVLAKVDSLSLVQDSSSKIIKEVSEIEIRIYEQQKRLEACKAELKIKISATLADLAFDCENEIDRLTSAKRILQESLESEKILNKNDFFSKLDLDSYDGRFRANSLLKRLKVRAFIRTENNKVGPTYIFFQGPQAIIGVHYTHDMPDPYISGFTADQVERMKNQEHNPTLDSSLHMLTVEYALKKWDPATLEANLIAVLEQHGLL